MNPIIEQILSKDSPLEKIEDLKKGRIHDLPDVEEYKKDWDPKCHKVFDRVYLPNKKKKTEDGSTVEVDVNRIAIPFQKKIVNTSVSFAFGNPVVLHANFEKGSNEEKIFNAISKMDYSCKLRSFNRRIYRDLLRATEIAEYWYLIDSENSELGFDSQYKVRVAKFSPWEGSTLYPYFDHSGDMIAFSREYILAREKIKVFETYTDKDIITWYVKDGNIREEIKTHNFGKIPIVYARQECAEWMDVQNNIERLEYLLSKFAETNDYHASPTVFVTGDIISMPGKGESGKVIQGKQGAEAKYLSWNNAPEAIKLEIETLLRFIFSFTQTVDVSFDSVKGLQSISGIALEMLFMDAKLKIEEKKEILDDYLQRRVNIQKRIAGILLGLKKEAESLHIEPEIVPFFVNDEDGMINRLLNATGNKPILSRKTAIGMSGLVDDAGKELELIQEEEEKERASVIFDN
jgi:SPP1 family phage portal protein